MNASTDLFDWKSYNWPNKAEELKSLPEVAMRHKDFCERLSCIFEKPSSPSTQVKCLFTNRIYVLKDLMLDWRLTSLLDRLLPIPGPEAYKICYEGDLIYIRKGKRTFC